MDVAKTSSRGTRVGCHGIFNSSYQKTRGFTLIELVISITLISILAIISIPSFQGTITSNRIATQVNEIVGTLAYSRSEAVTRQQRLTLCQTSNQTECERSGDWSMGWMLFIDSNKDRVLDESEELLHVQQELAEGLVVQFNGSGGRDGYIVYKPDGTAYPNGSFFICHPDFPELSKALIMKHNGRLRTSNRTSSGRRIDCSVNS